MSKERNKARGTFQIERNVNLPGAAFVVGALALGITLVIVVVSFLANR